MSKLVALGKIRTTQNLDESSRIRQRQVKPNKNQVNSGKFKQSQNNLKQDQVKSDKLTLMLTEI